MAHLRATVPRRAEPSVAATEALRAIGEPLRALEAEIAPPHRLRQPIPRRADDRVEEATRRP